MGYSNTPEEGNDIIDSRDVIDRISDLEVELDVLLEKGEIENADEFIDFDELDKLRDLVSKGEDSSEWQYGVSEWQYGVALIREDYFVDYAQQLAEDIGAINPDAAWPANCIDWERAARELATDYDTIEFGSTTYYVRLG